MAESRIQVAMIFTVIPNFSEAHDREGRIHHLFNRATKLHKDADDNRQMAQSLKRKKMPDIGYGDRADTLRSQAKKAAKISRKFRKKASKSWKDRT